MKVPSACFKRKGGEGQRTCSHERSLSFLTDNIQYLSAVTKSLPVMETHHHYKSSLLGNLKFSNFLLWSDTLGEAEIVYLTSLDPVYCLRIN